MFKTPSFLGIVVKQECAESVVQSTTETEPEEEEIQDEEGPLPYPYSNDEFGVPILDLSSDSEMVSSLCHLIRLSLVFMRR